MCFKKELHFSNANIILSWFCSIYYLSIAKLCKVIQILIDLDAKRTRPINKILISRD